MSKRHSEQLANVLRGQLAAAESADMRIALIRVAYKIADVCADDNARFDKARFLAACGVDKA